MKPEGMEIRGYNDFVTALHKVGFSMGGGNNEAIYSVIDCNWNETPSYDTPVRWHTGDPETDPWEWRMRVIDEREGIAYAKLFFRKSGYITKELYPYFLAVRRGGKTIEEEYADGMISPHAKNIYETVLKSGEAALHDIKADAGFFKQDKSKFDRALTELQMKMYLTICGRHQKVSQKGEEYGWSSTVFCATEAFFGAEVFEKAAKITRQEAEEYITDRVLLLNPSAEHKRIMKFIRG